MKLRTILFIGGGAALLLLLVSTYWVYSSLDEFVRKAIETYGSEIMGTAVRVDSVSLNLREGSGTIAGFSVANPQGYPAGTCIGLEKITLDIDIASLTSGGPIGIDAIEISAPSVALIADENAGTNLQALQANIDRYASQGARTPEPATEESGPEPLLRIAKLAMEGGRVDADLSALGADPVGVELPPLRLSNLGGQKGSTPSEIGTLVAKAFVRSTVDVVAKAQINDRLDDVIDEKIGGKEGEAVKGIMRGLFNDK